jgi:hypothetical protein
VRNRARWSDAARSIAVVVVSAGRKYRAAHCRGSHASLRLSASKGVLRQFVCPLCVLCVSFLPPGIIGLLFRLRWDIEKSFDEFENKLAEKKAWATSKTAKTIQSHFTAIAYNLLLLALNDLENQHHLRDTKVEEKYERWMDRRQAIAEQLGRTVNSLVQSVRRISEHSLQILRWLRHHLRARSTLEASLSDAPAYFFSYI